MKTIAIVMAVLFFGLPSCSNPKDKENGRKEVTIKGVINDGYLKLYPYYVKSGDEEIALDVADLSGLELGKVYEVAGDLGVDNGVQVLSRVSIDGVYYMTNEEWHKANEGDDPFD